MALELLKPVVSENVHRVDLNAPIPLEAPPANHQVLVQAYEKIVARQLKREVGATFLADGKNFVEPVFAVTGTETSIEDIQYDYHLELLRGLEAGEVDTLVFFHSHPGETEIEPGFSEADYDIFLELTMSSRNQKGIRIYFAVSNLNGQYAWTGVLLRGEPDLVAIDLMKIREPIKTASLPFPKEKQLDGTITPLVWPKDRFLKE